MKPKRRKPDLRHLAILRIKRPGKILLAFHRREMRFSDEARFPRLQGYGYLGEPSMETCSGVRGAGEPYFK